jgi:putative ABC transport system permease protein
MTSHFRFALRSLVKSRAYSVVAIITLSLGIGASTAIFSVAHALLLTPMPYADSRRLAQIHTLHPEQGRSVLAPALFQDLAASTQLFETVAAFRWNYANISRTATPTQVTDAFATPDWFKLFGVAPLHGRTWTPEECRKGAPRVAVLGHALWMSHFGGRPEAVGEQIWLDDGPHTIIGVMPATFKDPFNTAQMWRPFAMDDGEAQTRGSRFWNAFGRLKPGVTLEQAEAELETIAVRAAEAFPQNHKGWTLIAADLQGNVIGNYRQGVLVLLGAVACVVLITCANVAGLSVVRATARRKELAIRAAIGASGGQLLRQLLTESLVLAAVGGTLGILVGVWGLETLLASIPSGWLPRADEVSLDTAVLVAVLVLTLLTGLAFGLAPGWTAARTDANDALKDTGTRGSGGPAAQRMRSALVVTEIALAIVLLVGAGLLSKSFLSLLQNRPGMQTERVLSMVLSLSSQRYDTVDKRRDFYNRTIANVAALPGVQSASFTATTPFRWGIPVGFIPVGESQVRPDNIPQSLYDSVSLDYFNTTAIPLREGRLFTSADNAKAAPVVIISEGTARAFFGNQSAVGRRLTVPGSVQPGTQIPLSLEIVGVVGDVRRAGLSSEAPLQVYRPMEQRPTVFATLMVRTAVPAESLVNPIQKAIWAIDPDQPISQIATMDTLARNSLAQPRLYLSLFGVFAILAVGLAAIGLYGLIAYSVAQRTREFGIRLALGATREDVVRLVLGEGVRLTAVGVVLGLAGALVGAQVMAQMVYNTPVRDPVVFGAVTVLLVFVALAACLLPARRATRVNPIEALRTE